ncbi:hypothetical protein FI667_g7992, partial [Globisporangium splendens]
MRAEETALCNQLDHMLIGYDRQHRSIQADEREQNCALIDRAQQAYIEQVAMQQAVIRENEKLQHRIEDLAKFSRLIEIEQRREMKDSTGASGTNMPRELDKKNQTVDSMPTVIVARVVQRVNEKVSVLIQNAPSLDVATNIRYFNMLVKMTGRNAKNERVVALVQTIVNPAQTPKTADFLERHGIQQPQDIEWMKHGFSFLLLTEAHLDAATGERILQLHYGTHFECVSEDHARHLMIEVLGLASRWERMVLPNCHLTF